MTRPTDPLDPKAALVLFSGGQDSATCLAWALDRFERVETVGFDYGQRHNVELTARDRVRDALPNTARFDGRLGQDHRLPLPTFGAIGETAMTADIAVAWEEGGLPNTFVPGRNLAFFTFAAALAVRRGLGVLVGGMCGTDAAGYPDCRPDTISSMARTLALGVHPDIQVETPLMHRTKAETWSLAHALGGGPLVDLILEETHTCYLGDRSTRHPWGYGCGKCPACQERQKGYEAFLAA